MEYVKEVFARYDSRCIRVYQAYNPVIAKEAVALQNFGSSFSVNRMTWIKPSFLWLMYRPGVPAAFLTPDLLYQYSKHFSRPLEGAMTL